MATPRRGDTFSLDTLSEDRMRTITRSRTSVRQVLESIEEAKRGFPRPKVSAVIIRGINDDEVPDAQLARDRDLDVDSSSSAAGLESRGTAPRGQRMMPRRSGPVPRDRTCPPPSTS